MTFVGLQWLVPRVPTAVVGTFPLFNAVLAVAWGILLGGERLGVRNGLGGALILAGVALVALAGGSREKAS